MAANSLDGEAMPSFNSRPCERGDHFGKLVAFGYLCFNSRPCERGDGSRQHISNIGACVSIHAPARGATGNIGLSIYISQCFNSRPCERGDLSIARLASHMG